METSKPSAWKAWDIADIDIVTVQDVGVEGVEGILAAGGGDASSSKVAVIRRPFSASHPL